MADRKPIIFTITDKCKIMPPSEDDLADRAFNASITGKEPTEEELDDAYESWREDKIGEIEDGTIDATSDGVMILHQDVEVEG